MELKGRGVALRPHFYFSDGYGCVIRTCNVGLKWVDAIGQIPELAGRYKHLIRPADRVMATLRHEAGHAFCYVHRLYRLRKFRRLFEVRGSFYGTYPDAGWRPDAAARRRFRRGGYVHIFCLKHPDEDFANTFAAWLNPDSAWETRFREDPVALEKLHYVIDLVKRYGLRPYKNDSTDLDAPISALTYPVGVYLDRERIHRPGSNFRPRLPARFRGGARKGT